MRFYEQPRSLHTAAHNAFPTPIAPDGQEDLMLFAQAYSCALKFKILFRLLVVLQESNRQFSTPANISNQQGQVE